jgi:hypothetical protein
MILKVYLSNNNSTWEVFLPVREKELKVVLISNWNLGKHEV